MFAQSDDCSNAFVLTQLSNFCSRDSAYSTMGATTSTNTVPTCWGNAHDDVWFQFVAVGTGVNITVNGLTIASNGTLLDPKIALYSGFCSALSPLKCSSVNPLYDNTSSLFSGTLTIGATYYIRVNGSNTGSFQLCINNFMAVSTSNQDCITATTLCSNDPISVNTFNGSGNNTNEMGVSCFSSESQSSWYTWTAASNGALTFSLTPNNQSDDIDFFVYEIPPGGSCSDKIIRRCCSSSCLGPRGATGMNLMETDTVENPGCISPDNGFIKYLDMKAGTEYGLFIENASGGSGGFNLSFGDNFHVQGPVSSFTTNGSVVCDVNTAITFTNTSTGYSRLLWHFGSHASMDTTSSTAPQTLRFNTTGPHTVSLEIIGSTGCRVISYQTIYVLTSPSLNLGNDTVLCPGQNISLNASNKNSDPSTYFWLPGGQITPTVQVNTSGNYKVTVSNTCFNVTDSIRVTVLELPKVMLGQDTVLCVGSNMMLNAENAGGYIIYLWAPGNETTPLITVLYPGIYSVTVSLNGGCANKVIDSIHITHEDCDIVVPNVFSPNKDQANEHFVIKGLDKHPNSRLIIYNRWGNPIYENHNYKNDWDGAGHPDGVYYYVLYLAPSTVILSDKPTTKYGFMTLLR